MSALAEKIHSALFYGDYGAWARASKIVNDEVLILPESEQVAIVNEAVMEETPLFVIATVGGNTSKDRKNLIDLLIKAGADPLYKVPSKGISPLRQALRIHADDSPVNGVPNLVKIFLNNISSLELSDSDSKILEDARRIGSTKVSPEVEAILDRIEHTTPGEPASMLGGRRKTHKNRRNRKVTRRGNGRKGTRRAHRKH